MFIIVLVDPQIPPNTGNIGRLCAATDCELHLVGKLGFKLDDKHLKRAGLDYWEHVSWRYYEDCDLYFRNLDRKRCYFFTTKVDRLYTDISFKSGDYLVFGSETTGLSSEYLEDFSSNCCTIPMKNKSKGVRSLNLANSVGIVLYEALRQTR